MEDLTEKKQKFTESITAKAIIIGILTLIMLIPSSMIEELISERQRLSDQVIFDLNNEWSLDQTVTGPILAIPYEYSYKENKKNYTEEHSFYVLPENLTINGKLFPEIKHRGIYNSILYTSNLQIFGNFPKPDFGEVQHTKIKWDQAYIMIGLSDLRGIRNNVKLKINNMSFPAEPDGIDESIIKQGLSITPKNAAVFESDSNINFSCAINLNGSTSINFIPTGKTTHVNISGKWDSPKFIGAFSPDHTIDKNGFSAKWQVLHYNRNLPQTFVDKSPEFNSSSFGVNLLETVGLYQKNMRSAKYALMFIALTFVVFFFVEILSKKKIHPIQYLLVAIALILFYSLLLSISEQINFDFAYLIASLSTIALITSYTYSIFKNKGKTIVMGGILSSLYIFLYVILQLEDLALLFGSLGLFVVLGIIMYLSRRIEWYKTNQKQIAE
jgi:inner membrane protein